MVDNEKVEKAFDECWEKNGGILYADIYKDDLKQIAKWFLMSGYAARDKEAEEEKRELIDALISIVKLHTLPDKTKEIDIAIEAIEKAAGKTIDEVIG